MKPTEKHVEKISKKIEKKINDYVELKTSKGKKTDKALSVFLRENGTFEIGKFTKDGYDDQKPNDTIIQLVFHSYKLQPRKWKLGEVKDHLNNAINMRYE